jgi:DNA-binding PadR family transcriptional regulator
MDTKASTLEMALMGLLTQAPKSGYDLRKTFSGTAWRHYSDSPGTIYPALKRLQKRGWIDSPAAPSDARQRREFRPTRKGKDSFIQWLAQPLNREAVRFETKEVMLRFAFMDGNVDRSVTLKFIEDLIAELKTHIAELQEVGTKMRADVQKATGRSIVHTGLLAFEAGLVGMEAQLAWAQKTRSRLIYANRA